MKKIYAFDFDGTLTTRDTLVEFIRYACGNRAFCWGFLRYSPGMPYEEFAQLGRLFALDCQHLLRPKGVEMVKKAQAEQAEVLIVSASIDNWVQPFFPEVRVVGTQVEVKDGHLTGRFLTKNCYGQEKVDRILAIYRHRQEYELIAFGDSRGDKELLAFADEAHYKPFRV